MEIGNYDPDPDKHRVSVLPARALDGCSSPPQPGMCHWLGVVRWKILSDRNFWFICVQKKKKSGDFGSHHISEIFHCLALVFRSLDADWQLNKPCRRVEAFLHFCLPSLLCEVAADPIRLLGSRAAVPLPWPGVRGQAGEEKQLTEALEWTLPNSAQPLWLAPLCLLHCLYLLSSRV